MTDIESMLKKAEALTELIQDALYLAEDRPFGCLCDWHSKTVGDGCVECNPEYEIEMLEGEA